MSHRQSVRAIVIKDQSLLVMKRNKFGMEYYTLVGGGIELGEAPEHALRRELQEEASLEVGAVRPVFMEDGGALYGVQYIYLCEYKGGEPAVHPGTIEGQLNNGGKNTYTVMWMPFDQLEQIAFRSESVRNAIVQSLRSGWPEQPVTLAWQPESMPK